MHPTTPYLSSQLPASASGGAGSALLQRTAATLLPPIPLYRRLLRVHRTVLSYEMRSLGDNYVKDEFRRHRKIDNPLQIVGFLGQWKVYLDQLEESALSNAGQSNTDKRTFFEGRKLDMDQFDKVSQVGTEDVAISLRRTPSLCFLFTSYPKSNCTSSTNS